MKKIFLAISGFVSFLLIGTSVVGQTTSSLEYTYDGAGNRTQRRVIEISLKENDTTSIDTNNRDQQYLQSNSDLLFSENLGDVNISVFPNPTQGKINLVYSGGEIPSNSKIEILNEAGVTISSLELKSEIQIIDFSVFPNGVYYLRLSADNNSKTFKVIKTY